MRLARASSRKITEKTRKEWHMLAYVIFLLYLCTRNLCEALKEQEIYGKFSEVDSSWRGLFKVVQ